MDGVPKNKRKALVFIDLSLWLNILTAPLAVFIGVMATDSPTSTKLDFWKGFLFIQAIPILILLISWTWWFIGRSKEKINT